MLIQYPRKAHVICWIIIGLFVQAQGFSTTVVKEGENATIECGLQTKVEEGYLTWEAITHDTTVVLAYDIRDGQSSCDDRIINCTLHANGSIQLESVSKEDGARYYRCLRGDEDGYNFYSDHKLLVLSKEAPSISQSPTSATTFKARRKGIVHSYREPACEDDVDGNLPVVCYPPSGIIVDIEYETIQCNCTDSDGLMDSVTFHVTRQVSSRPSIETSHRESVSSYNMGKKGVLHGYNAPVCEDDVDGNLQVVCYPPSGVIVDREYETILCNCTDSDGLMDSVTFPVTRITHEFHPGWRKAFISLSVILIPMVLILICCKLYKHLKKSKTNCGHVFYKRMPEGESKSATRKGDTERELEGASEREEMTLIGTEDKQISDLEDKIAALEATLNKSQTELTGREKEVSSLTDQLEKKETEMKNKLEEQNKKISKIEKDMAVKEAEHIGLGKQLEEKQQQISSLEKVIDKGGALLTTARVKSPKSFKNRRSIHMGIPSPPRGTPKRKSRTDQDVETDINGSHTTEDNENLGKDETDFSKSKGGSDDTGTNVSREFKNGEIDPFI